jgi:hypothetical protein
VTNKSEDPARDEKEDEFVALGIASSLPEIESELQIPRGFLLALQTTDDWSLVVKCHTLVEAAVTHLVITELNEPALHPIIDRMAMGNSGNGKVAFAKALGLLDARELRMLRHLGGLRNALAHDIQYVGASLTSLLAEKSPKEFDEIAEALAMWQTDEPSEEMRANIRRMMGRKPSFVIWVATVRILLKAYKLSQRAAFERLFKLESERKRNFGVALGLDSPTSKRKPQ